MEQKIKGRKSKWATDFLRSVLSNKYLNNKNSKKKTLHVVFYILFYKI